MIPRQIQSTLLTEQELRIAFERDGMKPYPARVRADKIIEARRKKYQQN